MIVPTLPMCLEDVAGITLARLLTNNSQRGTFLKENLRYFYGVSLKLYTDSLGPPSLNGYGMILVVVTISMV